jgi:hypothetical protein
MQVLTRVSVFFMHPHQILVNIISFSRLLWYTVRREPDSQVKVSRQNDTQKE